MVEILKRGTPSHPKVLRLLQALGLSRKSTALVIGHLELLWHFTAQYAPRGDIGRYGDDQIEAALHWYGRRGRLIEALTTSGWVEMSELYRLVVHDWHDHADESVRKKLNRASESFLSVTDKVSRHVETRAATLDESVCQPTPSLRLAKPEPEPLPAPHVVRSHAEFPETAQAIRESYPATDDAFVMKLCLAVHQKVISSDAPLRGEATDELIAEAVRDCRKNSPKQNSPGLFASTVPQCVLTWLTQGKGPSRSEVPFSDRGIKALELNAAINRRLSR